MAKDKIYIKVSNYLKQAISSGEMKLGEAIYSENRLCEILKVSRTSVRRAIREMVEENILESRQGKGTFVRGLERSQSVCLLNHYTRHLRLNKINSYYPDIIFSAEQTASEHNCRMMIYSKPFLQAKAVPGQLQLLNSEGFLIDGAFQDIPGEDITGAIYQYNRNSVIVDGNPEETGIPTISPDWESGFSQLFSQYDLSEMNILFINNSTIARNRWGYACFKRTSRTFGLKSDYLDYSENISPEILNQIDHGYILFPVLENLLSIKKYDIIFCVNDYLAMQVLNFAHCNALQVPGDFKLFGLGGLECAAAVVPALSTLKVYSGSMAQRAMDMLIGMIRRKSKPERILIPVQLLVRDSL